MIKTIFSGLVSLFVVLSVILGYNWQQNVKFEHNFKPVEQIFLDNTDIPETLSKLIQFETISGENATSNSPDAFNALTHYLTQRFPLTHQTLEKHNVGNNSLVYFWNGSNSSLNPVMFSAHFDVVSVEQESWSKAPFSGTIDDKFVWGRGALDDKSSIVAILHSIETLLSGGYHPKRTLILALGEDEETGGQHGAKAISEFLASKNINPEFILDEGMPITDGIMKGIEKPVAMIGIAEKGYVNIKLTATANDGHTSAPPKHTAVGILASAIAKIENNPMPAKISQPIGKLFDTLAGDMQLLPSVVVSNRWLLEPALTSQLSQQNSTNALIRTTMATTMIAGSQQENVLPKKATATINVRILPGDTIKSVLSHIKKTIDTSSIQVEIIGDSGEPSPVSDTTNWSYHTIERSISQVFPDILIAPSLLIAGTDSKHYKKLTHSIYRFRPLWIRSDDIGRFHGSDERIGLQNLQQMTQFFYQLIINSSSVN